MKMHANARFFQITAPILTPASPASPAKARQTLPTRPIQRARAKRSQPPPSCLRTSLPHIFPSRAGAKRTHVRQQSWRGVANERVARSRSSSPDRPRVMRPRPRGRRRSVDRGRRRPAIYSPESVFSPGRRRACGCAEGHTARFAIAREPAGSGGAAEVRACVETPRRKLGDPLFDQAIGPGPHRESLNGARR
jgi:hypothetical protein